MRTFLIYVLCATSLSAAVLSLRLWQQKGHAEKQVLELQEELGQRQRAVTADTSSAAVGTRRDTDMTVRLHELEQQLEQKLLLIGKLEEQLSAQPEAVVADIATQPPPTQPRRSAAEYMERLKTEDPQRFEEMRQRMREMNERMQAAVDQQENFFSQLDPKAMSEKQLENHGALLELLDRNRKLITAIDENPDAENVAELRRELFQNMRKSTELLASEREAALLELARGLGYSDHEAQQFREYVEYVMEMTSPAAMWRGVTPTASDGRRQ